MKVFVTGAAGYIGSHVCKALKISGHYVIATDVNKIEHKYFDERVYADLNHYDMYESFNNIKEPEFDACIHLAGLINVAEAEKYPLIYYYSNVAATINLLDALPQSCKKFIFSSSAAVYGNSVYGKTKSMVENILLDSKRFDLHLSLRYFNVAGADPDGEMGENHPNETHLIPLILQNKEVTVYGNNYPTADGTCIRDYIHVSDLANIHVKSLETQSLMNGYLNIGSGTGYSVLEIIDAINDYYGNPLKQIKVNYAEKRTGDAAILVAPDSTESLQRINYNLIYNLQDIIRTAVQWEIIQQRKPKQ